jgi:hypothetical protein
MCLVCAREEVPKINWNGSQIRNGEKEEIVDNTCIVYTLSFSPKASPIYVPISFDMLGMVVVLWLYSNVCPAFLPFAAACRVWTEESSWCLDGAIVKLPIFCHRSTNQRERGPAGWVSISSVSHFFPPLRACVCSTPALRFFSSCRRWPRYFDRRWTLILYPPVGYPFRKEMYDNLVKS